MVDEDNAQQGEVRIERGDLGEKDIGINELTKMVRPRDPARRRKLFNRRSDRNLK
jgi:uncharacterized protein YPO0396